MAGQTMAGFFSSRLAQLGAIYTHLMCVLVPGLNSGRLAAIVHMGIFRFEVPILQGGYQVIQEHFLTAKK